MPLDRLPPDDPLEWLNRARSSLAQAAHRDPDVYLEDLCFNAQQAAEKAFKAVLLKEQRTFPPVHQIGHLIGLLDEIGIIIPAELREAARLTDYAVQARYPGPADPVTEDRYLWALHTARQVVDWVALRLGRPGAWVAGVDGSPYGWCVVLCNLGTGQLRVRAVSTFQEVFELPEHPQTVAVDIPIGLPKYAQRGGRTCDGIARRMLGAVRGTSVFPAPTRATLAHRTDHQAVCDANRTETGRAVGVSIQCFGLLKKIAEVDNVLSNPSTRGMVYEIHPELCFYEMNERRPIVEPKRNVAGLQVRATLLSQAGMPGLVDQWRADREVKRQCGLNDVLDAGAACWTATRIANDSALRIPVLPEHDETGLPMEMWR
jgi:predicted RNase H-like nuclease/HEPN domain-containing protein